MTKGSRTRNKTAPAPDVGAATTRLILSIFRTNGRLLRAGDVLTKDFGLTAARWQVLAAIDEKPKTVAQIARDFELTRQGVLWVVQAMVKDGMVELIRNPDHRRAKLVRATDRGQEVYREITKRQRDWAAGLEQGFAIPELNAALDVVRRLGEAVIAPEDEEA